MTDLKLEPDCRNCSCPASWHLKSKAQARNKIKRLRCIAYKPKPNGFPGPCGCTEYRVGRAA